MPEFEIHRHNVHYTDTGAGMPVLFGHSSASTGGQWKALINMLAPRYRCLAPDHIGYGRTAVYRGTPDIISLELDILEKLLHKLNAPVHLVGHSYGGALVTRLALRLPRYVRSLTIVEPTFFHLLDQFGKTDADEEIKQVANRTVQLVDAGLHEQAARNFIAYWVSSGAFDAMPAKIQAAVAKGMEKVSTEWQTIIPGPSPSPDELARLSCPKFLVSGGQTTYAAHCVMDIMRQIWPDAIYWQLDEANHMLPVTHPAEVNAQIEQFLLTMDGSL